MNPRLRRRPQNQRTEGPKEEYAIVLDLVFDQTNSYKSDELAQAIGTKTYTLLELVPKEDVILNPNDKVYIGAEKREEIQFIKRTLKVEDLSSTAKGELFYVIASIVKEREEEYVKFFNMAGPISLRKHSLELVHGVGKKHLDDLLKQREEKPFESFEDISQRCHFLGKPEEALAHRIVDEIEGNDDFKFFTRK